LQGAGAPCRLPGWINNPQRPRIHHSALMEHRDKDFAAIFPIFDILFDTAWVPTPGEYTARGLVPAERVDIIISVIGLVRHFRHREFKDELG
jgi:sterol desaturase/sphingolipid hydroxylase (fatty acid hydroxylase superfamily)